MINLDRQLLFAARGLISAANVHLVKELIFAYEQAVDLHNRKRRGYEIYRVAPEVRLRNYVLEQQSLAMKAWRAAAIRRADRAMRRISR
jgi:hypothetical protein